MKRKIFCIVAICLTMHSFSGYFSRFTTPYGQQLLQTPGKVGTPFIRQTPTSLLNQARGFNTQAQNFGYWKTFSNRFSRWGNQFKNYIPQSIRSLFAQYPTPIATGLAFGTSAGMGVRLAQEKHADDQDTYAISLPHFDKPDLLTPHVVTNTPARRIAYDDEYDTQNVVTAEAHQEQYSYTNDDRQKIFNILDQAHVTYDPQASTPELFKLFAETQAQRIAYDDVRGTNRAKFKKYCDDTALDARKYPIFREIIGEILVEAKNKGQPLSIIRQILNAYVDVMSYQTMYTYANLAEDILDMLETNDQKKEDKLLLTMDLLNKDPGAAFMFNYGILYNEDRRPAERLNNLMLNEHNRTIEKLLAILVQHSGPTDDKINKALEGTKYDELRNTLIHRRKEYDRKNGRNTTSRFMPMEPADMI